MEKPGFSPGRQRGSHTLIVLFLVLVSFLLVHCSDSGEKLEPVGISLSSGENFETELGTLEGGFLLQNGNKLKNGQIVFGAIHMDSNQAFAIREAIDILETEQELDVEVTLVQDKVTGEWLATQGWLGLKEGEPYILENCRVTVLGGKDNPIMIAGRPQADRTLVARK